MTDTFEHLHVKLAQSLVFFRRDCCRQRQRHHHRALDVETRLDIHHFEKAASEQSGSRQQHQSHTDLRDYECTA